eukprot:TRINITY_DN59911_c0_g1_i1.p1 TRINITY_DN59911_c0_g1~~TRINITY_DN59911_c0_g1_i1.p1  ORF type:complete len:127 (+),score=8.21 TRINITY_DN59911_c0_g1_i1:141-521(+)
MQVIHVFASALIVGVSNLVQASDGPRRGEHQHQLLRRLHGDSTGHSCDGLAGFEFDANAKCDADCLTYTCFSVNRMQQCSGCKSNAYCYPCANQPKSTGRASRTSGAKKHMVSLLGLALVLQRVLC